MPTISVIIITKNEATRIEACLRSIAWADEIIIIDSGSLDATIDICKKYTQHIFSADWPGFGAQKNRALQKASGDWILSIDADEEVSDALRDEIRTVIANNPAYIAYSLRRISSYLGKTLHHGDWGNDNVVRLFQRHKAEFSLDLVHEKVLVDGAIGKLQHPLYHKTFVSLEQIIDKMNSYSSLSAQAKHANGQRATLRKAIGRSIWTFFRGYVLKLGFLDGREGFMLAVSNAETTYYRYLKLIYQ